ncbi:hypothetical protein EV182_003044 [Spiromyces aspiralis]|uniref:Uncharacterized protein n=1 Tax=Spiromyces aspiralis TaxID=68401 RepID=A0ACC1HUD6_9FUNG|nr:hypothetical protein EV182_003044 [Spiromyces aspiralis]
MDSYTIDIAHEAAEAGRNNDTPSGSSPSLTYDPKDTLSSVFSFASSWSKKIQQNVNLEKIVSEVKSQSEEVARLYKQDFVEISSAIKSTTSRGIEEINSRLNKLRTEKDASSDNGDSNQQRQISADDGEGIRRDASTTSSLEQARDEINSFFKALSQNFNKEKLLERQQKIQRMMKGLGNDIEGLLKEAIVIEAPDSGATEQQRAAARKIIYDQKQSQIITIQNDINTYIIDPTRSVLPIESGSIRLAMAEKSLGQLYEEFSRTFDLKEKEPETAIILQKNSDMCEIYLKIVPSKLDREVFWQRYFFRVWLLNQEEEQRKKLVRDAVAMNESEEMFDWGDDSDDGIEQQVADETQDDGERTSSGSRKEDSEPSASLKSEDERSIEASSKKDSDPSTKQETQTEDKRLKKGSKAKNNKSNDDDNENDDDGWDTWE